MDFFSKLGKKATKTYQITKEKATSLSEELKLKGKIGDAKDKIEELYKEIGEKVFEEIKAGRDVVKEEISEKIEAISELQDTIGKIKTEILALKNLKKCDNCGTELNLEDEYCSKCGTKQPKCEKIKVQEEVATEAQDAEVVEVKDAEHQQETAEENHDNEEKVEYNQENQE